MKKYAFLFPGQGAQYPGMGKDFSDHYAIAKETFQEADEILGRNLSKIIFEGPENVLTETRNSQPGIFVTSIAFLRVMKHLFRELAPAWTAGLSLGEYTALVASSKMDFKDALLLVEKRGKFMSDACDRTKGAMAVIMGLDADVVKKMVQEAHLPNDLFAANFNCPGQVVISGTVKGIEAGSALAKSLGAKRVLPLDVHGAFHSGLMREAGERLTPYIEESSLKESGIRLVMNVTGGFVEKADAIKENLVKQVTHSVLWEEGIRALSSENPDAYIEIGCGKTLAGMNKRIGVAAPTISIEKIADLELLQ